MNERDSEFAKDERSGSIKDGNGKHINMLDKRDWEFSARISKNDRKQCQRKA